MFAKLELAQEILKTVKMAKKAGAKISFDPNIRKELMGDEQVVEIVNEILSYTNVFLPGLEELMMLTGKKTEESAVRACFEMKNMDILVIKKGSKGSSVYTRKEMISAGVYKINAIDSTGAGDSFDGAFICGLIEGRPLSEVIRMASAAGALNTAAFGPMEGDISKETINKLTKEEIL